jgi:hypothetical protein
MSARTRSRGRRGAPTGEDEGGGLTGRRKAAEPAMTDAGADHGADSEATGPSGSMDSQRTALRFLARSWDMKGMEPQPRAPQ